MSRKYKLVETNAHRDYYKYKTPQKIFPPENF